MSNPITINRKNFDRSKTILEIDSIDFTKHLISMNYGMDREHEFGFGISNLPIISMNGKYTCTGSIRMYDSGLNALNEYAVSLGLTNYLELGISEQCTITVTYTTQEGVVVKDILYEVHFNSSSRGQEQGTLINEREISLSLGYVEYNAA